MPHFLRQAVALAASALGLLWRMHEHEHTTRWHHA